ncbi:hypothetical protein DFJ74DRAFT_682823 [Hyaloraphidium curvatum]|nr:hypothetical protein DFJ74DRAFT_682823 [Hyaloraphidium curvatum]
MNMHCICFTILLSHFTHFVAKLYSVLTKAVIKKPVHQTYLRAPNARFCCRIMWMVHYNGGNGGRCRGQARKTHDVVRKSALPSHLGVLIGAACLLRLQCRHLVDDFSTFNAARSNIWGMSRLW